MSVPAAERTRILPQLNLSASDVAAAAADAFCLNGIPQINARRVNAKDDDPQFLQDLENALTKELERHGRADGNRKVQLIGRSVTVTFF